MGMNNAWSHMAAKAQPAKPTLAARSSMQTLAQIREKNKQSDIGQDGWLSANPNR
jgi:hypothetical protein